MLTHEPGDSEVGRKLREILLSPETGALDHRAEALLYAADKAEHVEQARASRRSSGAPSSSPTATSTRPWPTRVLAGTFRPRRWSGSRGGPPADLRPHLTVLLDVDPALGLSRFDVPDRLEAEPLEFHRRVRDTFIGLATADPDHYLVVDAAQPAEAIAVVVREHVTGLLTRAVRHPIGSGREADA